MICMCVDNILGSSCVSVCMSNCVYMLVSVFVCVAGFMCVQLCVCECKVHVCATVGCVCVCEVFVFARVSMYIYVCLHMRTVYMLRGFMCVLCVCESA